MPRQALTPEQLFDRPWQPGRKFAPGAGRLRRWAMIVLLLLLCLVISGYGYITDAERVRAMSESYLSGLIGGPVKVGGATLSVFEGLRLDDVRVYVDENDNSAPDSLLFSAQTFILKYDPRMLLAGRLEATQIIAQKPQVYLAEDRDSGQWNYQRLAKRRRAATQPAGGPPGKPRVLPDVSLRNARVIISELRAGREVARGFMAIDGRLNTSEEDPDRVAFHLQSRGVSEGLGPYASGTVSLSSGQVVARLMNFEFDRDVRSMLPVEPREWWNYHQLAGTVSMPEISFVPGRGGRGEQFRIVTILNGVTLSVSPEEWMARTDVAHLQATRATAGMLGRLYRFAGKKSELRGQASGLTQAQGNPGDRLADLLTPAKVTLKNVAGTFVFTNGGIEVKDVSGFIESNGLKINGTIGGYRPDAPLSLRLSSFDTENITIPAAPRYISSLPREVREVYEQFKPEGECRLAVRVERPEPGSRPAVSGTVQILDGRFVFFRFPYPLRNVSGRIDFGSRGSSESSGGDGRMSLDIRGNGIATGPNRDTVLKVQTFGEEIGPIGTNICGVNVRISGENVASEDALTQAFPPEVQHALTNLDAHRTGKYPQYRGDFTTEVVRPVGFNKRWSFDTDVTLNSGSGALAAFPYPLHDMTGKLLIRSGYVELVDLGMRPKADAKDADGSLAVNGYIAWTTGDGPRGPQPRYHAPGSVLSPRVDAAVTTDMKVAVRGMPIDDELLTAIPKERREWVRKLGATGKLDVDGRILPADGAVEQQRRSNVEWVVGGKDEVPEAVATLVEGSPPPPAPSAPQMAYDLKLGVRDGTLRPFGKTFDVTGVAARLHLTPQRLAIEKVTGRRGDAQLSATGNIDWPQGQPRILINGNAAALMLDDALYQLLPGPARRGWDETQPRGTLDAEVHYDSVALEAERAASLAGQDTPAPPADAAAAPDQRVGLRVVLKPRELGVTLKSMPYRLDALTGAVRVEGNKVTVNEVAGRHGDARVVIAGVGVLGTTPVWDMRVGGERLPIDDELRAALPTALAGLAQAIKLDGKVSFNLTKFVYRGGGEAPAPLASAAPGARAQAAPEQPAPPGAEIDLAGSFAFDNAKMDVGVPLTDVVGTVKIEANVRDGHLDTLRGGVDFASMNMAGRPAKDFRAELLKPEGKSQLHLNRMRGEVAGGTMSGQMTLVYPDDGPSRYSLELVVRDADVRQLAWEKEETGVKGKLTASLSLEGSWGDGSQRRGRGDVLVSGRDMYRIPLVLGLLQVTNLALPISTPFNEATAVYSLDGSKVIFEQIKLTARNMLMEGNGSLDFDTKKVDLAFTTDNPNGLMKLPFLKELWAGARNEMLKIHVRGTIQEPEVSARSMGTFWTTVDEIMDKRPGDADDKKRRSK
jgi:hypothetical protein